VMRQRAAGAGEGRGSRIEDRKSKEGDPRSSIPKAGWDVSVDGITAQANSRPATGLIAADQELGQTFQDNAEAARPGLIVLLPDLFDEGGKLMVHARPPGGAEWIQVGELERPVDKKPGQPGQERVTEYPRRYRLTLDDAGVLRVHLGEVPYWKTE